MLKSLTPKLACPTCRDPNIQLELHVFNEGADNHVRDGLLVCSGCRAWYPIEDELLELVVARFLDRDDLSSFVERFADQFAAAGVRPVILGDQDDTEVDLEAQFKQREHFDLYAECGTPGFEDYTQSRFFKAGSKRYQTLWANKLKRRDSWLLDIGCGTGNNSFPYAEDHTVIGFDISKGMIRGDIEEARARGCGLKTTFFVGDGAFPPFKDASFDYVHTFGALHHLPNPAEAIRDIERILVPGGLYFAVENNLSVFRGIFDLLMKFYPLWIEEAGAEPLMSRRMIEDWCQGLPVRIITETSIFVPPQLINLFGQNVANKMVDWIDRFFSHLPLIKEHGGLLLFTIVKASAPPPAPG